MQLSLYSDYTLRVLMYLGAKDGRSSIDEIASAYSISAHHLVKIAHQLGRLGYLTTVRGRGGGVALARNPDEVRIGEVLRDTENFRIVECFDPEADECVLSRGCLLKKALAEATEAFLRVLDRYTLGDLIAGSRSRRRTLKKMLQIVG